MCDIAGVCVLHRDLTNHPMPCRTVVGDSLLLDPFNSPCAKRPFELLADAALRVLFKNVKNVAAYSKVAGYSEFSNFTMAIPGNDAIFAVDNIERDRQCIE